MLGSLLRIRMLVWFRKVTKREAWQFPLQPHNKPLDVGCPAASCQHCHLCAFMLRGPERQSRAWNLVSSLRRSPHNDGCFSKTFWVRYIITLQTLSVDWSSAAWIHAYEHGSFSMEKRQGNFASAMESSRCLNWESAKQLEKDPVFLWMVATCWISPIQILKTFNSRGYIICLRNFS